MRKRPKIIVIVGPNASGKSELGVRLARKIGGEIISADSRQVYRGLDIGSGKITKKEMRGVPHHCIDIANPKKVFTALDFKNCAKDAIADIVLRGKTPIIVGGTGFYIDAALGRVKLGGVPPNHALRKKLANYSTIQLLNYLTKLDPKRAKTIEQKNPVRLIRAIEIALASKALLPSPKREANELLTDFAAFSAWSPPKAERKGQATSEPRAGAARMRSEVALASLEIQWLGIKRPPDELKKRIEKRLIARIPGIIREVKKLRRNSVSWKRLYDLGLEYRYVSLYLRGKISKLQLTQQLTSQIWHYAKRQMTWFKKNKEIRWIQKEKEALSLL